MEAGRARVRTSLPSTPSATGLSAVLETLDAVHSYQERLTAGAISSTDSNAAVLMLAEQISRHAAAAFMVLPDVATDAVFLTWQSARPLLEGAVGAEDGGAEEAAKVGKHAMLILAAAFCHVACTNKHTLGTLLCLSHSAAAYMYEAADRRWSKPVRPHYSRTVCGTLQITNLAQPISVLYFVSTDCASSALRSACDVTCLFVALVIHWARDSNARSWSGGHDAAGPPVSTCSNASSALA